MHTVLERGRDAHRNPCAHSYCVPAPPHAEKYPILAHYVCISIISQHFLPCAFLLCSSTVGVHFYCIAALFACFSIIPQHCIPALYACISTIFKHFSGCIYTRLYLYVYVFRCIHREDLPEVGSCTIAFGECA